MRRDTSATTGRERASSSRDRVGCGELAAQPCSSAAASAPSAIQQTPRAVVATISAPSGLGDTVNAIDALAPPTP